eukprot:scaffold666_cov332-Prasinococcus_capsulatus_cf.AAC.21
MSVDSHGRSALPARSLPGGGTGGPPPAIQGAPPRKCKSGAFRARIGAKGGPEGGIVGACGTGPRRGRPTHGNIGPRRKIQKNEHPSDRKKVCNTLPRALERGSGRGRGRVRVRVRVRIRSSSRAGTS